MEEAEQNSENQEVAPQEAENQTPEQTQQEQDQQKEAKSYVDQEKNWRAVRKRIQELERSVQEKDELLKQALDYQKSLNQEPEEPEPDLDEYANYGGVKKLASKTVEPLQKEVDQLKQQLEQQRQRELMQNLRNRYPDFDQVVNPETIELFEEKEPEVATFIAEIKDPYKMGVQTYKFIKSAGLVGDVPDKRRKKEVEEKIEKNKKTVQSPQAYDKRPMAQAFQMTKEYKQQLYEEMMGYARQASTARPMGS